MSVSVLFCVLVALAVYVVRRNRAKLTRERLPPGPPADPLIGHLRVFPQTDLAERLYEWSKLYGDVMHLDLLGKSMIVLSSKQAVSDLLDKRSAIYSDRPDFPAFSLLGWDDMLVFLRYGPDFHTQRKMLQQPLTRQGCLVFRPCQLDHCRIMVKNMLRTPEDFALHVRRFTSGITLEMTYGHKVDSGGDAYLEVADRVNVVLTKMAKAAVLELFPSLQKLPPWFPGAWFVRYAQENQPLKSEMGDRPFEEVQRQLAEGKAQPSFVSLHLEEMAREGTDNPDNLNLLKTAAMHMWTGGEDTTWSTIMIFILAVLLNPEAAKKAQAEIDRVVGPGRLPTFEDQESLPYVQAFLYETRRWHTAIPLGIPHRVMTDDIYRDMLIPKDSTILVNMGAIALDKTVYKNPHSFWPERYLPENGEPIPTEVVYGFGRRICPGRFLADASVWIVAANILAAFDILPVQDGNGRDVLPKVEFTEALTSHPASFECRIKPRSKQVEDLITQL